MSYIPSYIDLNGEAGIVLGIFGFVSLGLIGWSEYMTKIAPFSSKSSKYNPKVTKQILLDLIEAAKGDMDSIHGKLLQTIESHSKKMQTAARMGQQVEPIGFSKLNQIFLSELEVKETARLLELKLDAADVAAAYKHFSKDKDLIKACEELNKMHPLHMDPTTVLDLQRKISEEEIAIYAKAVELANIRNVSLNSQEFRTIAGSIMRLSGGGSKDGDPDQVTMIEKVLEDAGYGDRAPLWAFIIGGIIFDEIEKTGSSPFRLQFLDIMNKQKAVLSGFGLNVA